MCRLLAFGVTADSVSKASSKWLAKDDAREIVMITITITTHTVDTDTGFTLLGGCSSYLKRLIQHVLSFVFSKEVNYNLTAIDNFL